MSAENAARGSGKQILLAAFALVLLCGGWIAYRVASQPRAPQQPPNEVAVAPAPSGDPPVPAPPSAASVPSAPTSGGLPAAPAPRIPGTPAPAPEVAVTPPEGVATAPATAPMGDEPAIDDIVKKEAPKYAADKPKGEAVVLTPIAVRIAAARDPAQVAAGIDRVIDAKLKDAKIPASPRADDAEFLRRVYLDLTGCIPPIAKVRAFLADTDADKRDKLIDELLASHEYGERFAHYWHELVVKRDPENNGPIQTHDVFVKWLTRQFNQNRGWDQIVRAMLTAEGDQALAGETFFILANCDNGQPAPEKIVGTAAALFLGNQLQCAECHVHPVVPVWKQQDFWGLAAFFGKTHAVRNGGAKMPTDALARITDGGAGPAPKKGAAPVPGTLPDGSIPIPDPRNVGKTIGVAKAKLFGEGNAPVGANSVNRGFAADWFVSPKNPFFARAAANRMWSVFFGRGLVNPLDDIRPDTRVSHLELLELLAEEFIASKHDTKHLIRCLCRSSAYQRTSRTAPQNKDDEELYSHVAVKAIPPRALFASLALVTNNRVHIPREEAGGKKGAPADGFGFFDTREYDESPTEYTNTVPQLLRLMNTQLPPACDAVARALPKFGSREEAVEYLYLLTLGRAPTPAEVGRFSAFIGKRSDPVKGYSAALWVLLQTAEFFNNH